MHRQVRELMDLLVYECLGCHEKKPYRELLEHIKTCEKAKKWIEDKEKKESEEFDVEPTALKNYSDDDD